MVDVEQLRADAAARAAARPLTAFDGDVVDDAILGVGIRRYLSAEVEPAAAPAIFLHGGYGVFGDLNLQDGYCRRLARSLALPIVAVDYPLAPEHSFDQSVAAVTAVAEEFSTSGSVILCGDSAGGAVAVGAAKRLGPTAAALVLSNPNLDFTLSSFDSAQPAGPDLGISRFAFAAWHRDEMLVQLPRLHLDVEGLPPALVAVGTNDSLIPEARALAESYQRGGRRCQLIEISGAGHGFVGDPDASELFLRRIRQFLRHTPTSA